MIPELVLKFMRLQKTAFCCIVKIQAGWNYIRRVGLTGAVFRGVYDVAQEKILLVKYVQAAAGNDMQRGNVCPIPRFRSSFYGTKGQ